MAGIKSQFGCNGNARRQPLARHISDNRGEFHGDPDADGKAGNMSRRRVGPRPIRGILTAASDSD
jgi:hypothetical protein